MKKLSIALALLFSFTLISCNKDDIVTNNDTTQITDNNSKNDTSTTITSENIQNFKLSLYSVDANTEKLTKTSFIEFKGNTSIEDCLKEIAKTTSNKSFNNLPITFEKIETINGKKVATINLNETQENKDKSFENIKGSNWLYGYFQGSTGGNITSTILTENFLQKEYKGNWIDGVKFNYNGKPISSQHVEILSQIIYK